MIQECPECKGAVSDRAASCPHCGHPFTKPAPPEQAASHKGSLFAVLALCALLVTFFTPRLIATLPILATLAFAAISVFRRERGRLLSIFVFIFATAILVGSSLPSTSLSGEDASFLPGEDASSMNAVEIVDWNWAPEPPIGKHGKVRWRLQVRNVSQKFIDLVRIELNTYDDAGKLVSEENAFISAIPPDETRDHNTSSDYYGIEIPVKANVRVANVRFNPR